MIKKKPRIKVLSDNNAPIVILLWNIRLQFSIMTLMSNASIQNLFRSQIILLILILQVLLLFLWVSASVPHSIL